ncbi:MAG: hypothetical protein ACK56I_26120, partial [bacterium]
RALRDRPRHHRRAAPRDATQQQGARHALLLHRRHPSAGVGSTRQVGCSSGRAEPQPPARGSAAGGSRDGDRRPSAERPCGRGGAARLRGDHAAGSRLRRDLSQALRCASG